MNPRERLLREKLICAALTGLLADPEDIDLIAGCTCAQSVGIRAVAIADAVIEQLKNEEPKNHENRRS